MSGRDEVDEIIRQLEEREDTPSDLVRQLADDWREMQDKMDELVEIFGRAKRRMVLIERHAKMIDLVAFEQSVKNDLDRL